MYNPHLGLINAPPPYLFLPKNDVVQYSFAINKARNILNVGPNLVHYSFTIKKARSGGLGLY